MPINTITFSGLLNKLLFEITARTHSTVSDSDFSSHGDLGSNSDGNNFNFCFSDILDSLLRRIAVLDPYKFLKIVRTATDNYLKNFNFEGPESGIEENLKKKINPMITSQLSGLLEHGEMLVNFMK